MAINSINKFREQRKGLFLFFGILFCFLDIGFTQNVTMFGTSYELTTDWISGGGQGTIPSEIGMLSQLTYLVLSNNHISGTIPSEIGKLILLNWFVLSDNEISGTIPFEIGLLSQLTYLYLSNNKIIGTIPSEIGKLTLLNSVGLLNNIISGNIPSEIGTLSLLTYLDLYENQISGMIPSEIGKLTNLPYLFLHNNQISGPIPSEIGKLTQLTRLYLFNNQIAGTIPSEIGKLTFLTSLRLENNKISGKIPSEIGKLSRVLSYFFLFDNEISGIIPSEIGKMILYQFQVDNTKLELLNDQYSTNVCSRITTCSNSYILESVCSKCDGNPSTTTTTPTSSVTYSPTPSETTSFSSSPTVSLQPQSQSTNSNTFSCGDSISGTIFPPNRTNPHTRNEFFSFTISEKDTHQVFDTCSSSQDIYLRIMGGDTDIVYGCNNCGSCSNQLCTSLPPGVYTLMVGFSLKSGYFNIRMICDDGESSSPITSCASSSVPLISFYSVMNLVPTQSVCFSAKKSITKRN